MAYVKKRVVVSPRRNPLAVGVIMKVPFFLLVVGSNQIIRY
jgi:hypothetical protein